MMASAFLILFSRRNMSSSFTLPDMPEGIGERR
jgi:hypothetical protein